MVEHEGNANRQMVGIRADVAKHEQQLGELRHAIVLLSKASDRVDTALFGADQRTGLVGDVAGMAATLRILVWIIGVLGTATVGTLATMVVRGAALSGAGS